MRWTIVSVRARLRACASVRWIAPRLLTLVFGAAECSTGSAAAFDATGLTDRAERSGKARVVAGLTGVKWVAGSGPGFAAVTSDARPWLTRALFSTHAPVQPVAGFSGAEEVACSPGNCVLLNTDATVWCLGGTPTPARILNILIS